MVVRTRTERVYGVVTGDSVWKAGMGRWTDRWRWCGWGEDHHRRGLEWREVYPGWNPHCGHSPEDWELGWCPRAVRIPPLSEWKRPPIPP